MATRKILSDAQKLILNNAAIHPDHGIFPLPTGFRARGAVRQKVLAALLKQGFVAERGTADDSMAWRRDARRHRLTLVMTANGSHAIGLSIDGVVVPNLVSVADVLPIDRNGNNTSDGNGGTNTSATAATGPSGKLGSVLSALATEGGATLAALASLTGWLPHTTRAALCRLRQRGFAIRLVGDTGKRAYRLDTPAQG